MPNFPQSSVQVLNFPRIQPVSQAGVWNVNSSISFADGQQVDAFGRLRVSLPETAFDAQQEYGLDTLRVWDATANGTMATASTNGSVTNGGNAVGPTNTDTRVTPITVSDVDGEYAVLQSRQYTRYVPGKGHLVFCTGVFAYSAGSAFITIRTSTSGSVTELERKAQSEWNIDTFGAGAKNPSGISLDFTKTQILVIQAQWLGVGRVVVGFDVNGVLYPAHQFIEHANVIDVPYTQTFNLPVRYELRTDANYTYSRVGYFDSNNGVFFEYVHDTKGGTIGMICCSVQSESGAEMRGFPQSASNGVTTIGVTTRRPILSIRPKTTFNSRTNRAHIELAEVELTASSNSSYWELVVDGTLTGAAFASVSPNSVAEYDVAATAISGGGTIASGFVVSGSGATRGFTSGAADFRSPMVLSQIDALTARQIPVSIVCTSFSGTSSVSGALHWHEQTI